MINWNGSFLFSLERAGPAGPAQGGPQDAGGGGGTITTSARHANPQPVAVRLANLFERTDSERKRAPLTSTECAAAVRLRIGSHWFALVRIGPRRARVEQEQEQEHARTIRYEAARSDSGAEMIHWMIDRRWQRARGQRLHHFRSRAHSFCSRSDRIHSTRGAIMISRRVLEPLSLVGGDAAAQWLNARSPHAVREHR